MNFLSILTRDEIGNKLEINEQNKVFEELTKIIAKVYTKKDKNEISEILKKGTIRKFFSKSGAEGLCYPNLRTICIKPYMIKNIIDGLVNKTLVHETIHLIRAIQYHNKIEKNIIGFEEGATEYMTLKTVGSFGKYGSKYLLNSTGQKIEYNIPNTCYSECTSIMAQLAIIFGEDKLQEFVFGENNDLLKIIQNTCGKDFYKHLRKELNKYATDKIYAHQDILQLQNELLKRYYNPKFNEIKNIDDAITLFNQLQEINKVRAHFSEDTSFKDFYEEQYKKCAIRFGNDFEKLEYLKYQEAQFLNVTSKEKIINAFNISVKNFICNSDINLEQSLEIFNNTKRYIALYQDTLYQITIFKDNAILFNLGSEKEGIPSMTQTIITDKEKEMHKLNTRNPNSFKSNSVFYLRNSKDNRTLIIDGEEVQLKEVGLGITEEDVRAYYTLLNSLNRKKTLKERFLKFFLKDETKLLNSGENIVYTKKEKKDNSYIDSLKENVDGTPISSNEIPCSAQDKKIASEKDITL